MRKRNRADGVEINFNKQSDHTACECTVEDRIDNKQSSVDASSMDVSSMERNSSSQRFSDNDASRKAASVASNVEYKTETNWAKSKNGNNVPTNSARYMKTFRIKRERSVDDASDCTYDVACSRTSDGMSDITQLWDSGCSWMSYPQQSNSSDLQVEQVSILVII